MLYVCHHVGKLKKKKQCFFCFPFCVFQENTVKQGETLVEEMKATQEKSRHQTSELHAKEVEVLQSQVTNLKEELSSSRHKSQELEKSVTELQDFKVQTQVGTNLCSLLGI